MKRPVNITTRLIIPIVTVLLMIAATGCSLPFISDDDSDSEQEETPTATVAAQATATAAPTPRATPIPSPTPAPTPTPTPTPRATPAATPTADPAETAYRETVDEYATEMEASLRRIAQLMENPQFLSASWKDDVMTELETVRRIDRESRELTPPPRYEASHEKLLEALSEFTSAADDIEYGINNLSVPRLLEAQEKADRGQQLYLEAQELMPEE